MNTVKMLKHDAIIPIKVGTGFVQRLQSMLMSIMAEKSEEDINLLQQLLTRGDAYCTAQRD